VGGKVGLENFFLEWALKWAWQTFFWVDFLKFVGGLWALCATGLGGLWALDYAWPFFWVNG